MASEQSWNPSSECTTDEVQHHGHPQDSGPWRPSAAEITTPGSQISQSTVVPWTRELDEIINVLNQTHNLHLHTSASSNSQIPSTGRDEQSLRPQMAILDTNPISNLAGHCLVITMNINPSIEPPTHSSPTNTSYRGSSGPTDFDHIGLACDRFNARLARPMILDVIDDSETQTNQTF